MSIRITADAMVSDRTAHRAARANPGHEYGAWHVTWLPERRLDRNQAITAMVLAETVRRMQDDGLTEVVDHTHRLWPHIDAWAAELNLTGPHAVTLIADTALDLTMVADGPAPTGP